MAVESPFRQLLGPQFEQLPAVTRQLHGVTHPQAWTGQAEIRRGTGLLSRICAWLARLPPAAAQVPVSVALSTDTHGRQVWRRQFGTAHMPSCLQVDGSCLREDLGGVRLWFELSLQDAAIQWRVRRVRALRWLPLPARWFSQVHASSGADAQGRYRFVVHAQLPWIGLLVRYSGWLQANTD